MRIEQRIDRKSDFVEEKDCQSTVSKRNSDRKIELASPSHSYALSTLPIAEGKKKTLLFQYEYTYNYKKIRI